MRPSKRLLFTLKIKVSVVLQIIIIIIKLKVNKTEWTGLLAVLVCK